MVAGLMGRAGVGGRRRARAGRGAIEGSEQLAVCECQS